MIDITTETVLTLADAAKRLPTRSGRRIHVSTLYRWSQRGCRGIRLETAQLGGSRITSMQALQRFCERLGAADARASAPMAVTSARRRREIARAARELEQDGIG